MIDPNCSACFLGGDCIHGEQSPSDDDLVNAALRATISKLEIELARERSKVADLECALDMLEYSVGVRS